MSVFFSSQGFLSLMAILLVLSGCSAFSERHPVETEQASNTPSPRAVYRKGAEDGGLSPLEMNKLARSQVDPAHINKKNAYVKTVEQAKAEEQERLRVAKLERDLSVVKNDFKGLKSDIQRTDAAQAASAPPGAPPVSAVAVPTKKPSGIEIARVETLQAGIAPAAGVPAAAFKGVGGRVLNVRTGEYADKTRLVLDLDAPGEFTYDIDSAQNLLIIRLSSKAWNAAPEKVFLNSRVLQAYAAKISQDGYALVAVKLKGPSKVTGSAKLGQNDAGYYRIYVDVAPL